MAAKVKAGGKAKKERPRAKKKPVFGFKAIVSIAKKFKATIALALVLVAAYFLLSHGNFFIERRLLAQLSFSLAKPLNILAYTVSHLSLWHLAANLVSLAFFAAIVEAALNWKHVLGIFLFSAVFTVLIFSFLSPFAQLAGASAGVWGLMAAAFVLDAKKAVPAIAAVALLILLLFPVIGFAVSQREQSLMQKNMEIEASLAQAVESGNVKKAGQFAAEKAVAQREMQGFAESSKAAAEAKVDLFLHSYAGILGIAYLLLFRLEETKEAVKKQRLRLALKRKL